MSISITRDSALTAQLDPAPDFRAAAAAGQGAEPAAQVTAKPTADYSAHALKRRFDNTYSVFQSAWQDCLVYAAAEFLYEQHRTDGVLPHVYYSDGSGQEMATVDDWYDVLTRYASDQGIAFRNTKWGDGTLSTVAELKASFKSKSPAAAAPYMAKAMAHFNTAGSNVHKWMSGLVSLSADVGSYWVSKGAAFTLLGRYNGVTSHWSLMIKCMEPDGGIVTDMFNKIKKKAFSGGK